MSNDSSSIAAKTERPAVSWGPGIAVLLTIGSYIFSSVVGGIAVSLLPAVLGWDGARIELWMRDSVVAQFLYVLLIEAVTVGILWWFLRRRKASLRAIGFTRRPRASDAGWAIGGFLAYFAIFVGVSTLLTALGYLDVDQRQELIFDSGATAGFVPLALVFLSLVILPPLVEEALFRGFLFSGLRQRFRVVTAVVITSALFALPHMLQSSTGVLWIGGLDTFILSLVLCSLRVQTDSLWAGIFLHGLKNGVAFVSLFILHLG